MTNADIIEELCDLIRFDHDAIGAYDEAIDGVTEPGIQSQLTAFRGDHVRHVEELSAIVRRLGGTPPETPGVRGIVRKTMTKVAGLAGTEAILLAMRSNEDALNLQYGKRAKLAFPPDILEVVERGFADEQRHLGWVKTALRDRPWEKGQPTA